MNNLIKIEEVVSKTTLSISSIYRMMATGDFPKAFKISQRGRSIAWNEQDVDRWIDCVSRGLPWVPDVVFDAKGASVDPTVNKERDMLLAYFQRVRKALELLNEHPNSEMAINNAKAALNETSDWDLWQKRRNSSVK